MCCPTGFWYLCTTYVLYTMYLPFCGKYQTEQKPVLKFSATATATTTTADAAAAADDVAADDDDKLLSDRANPIGTQVSPSSF
jgi:hypothetical protein